MSIADRFAALDAGDRLLGRKLAELRAEASGLRREAEEMCAGLSPDAVPAEPQGEGDRQ